MTSAISRTVCWSPIWNPGRKGTGLEHLVIAGRSADGTVLAVNEEDDQPFRLTYRLAWDDSCRLREADLAVLAAGQTRTLSLRADGEGHWRHADGGYIANLDGCIDIDIWPTPFTNSFPIWRSQMPVGTRQEFRMAWVSAPALTVEAKPQAYSRLEDRLYLFESLDGSGFRVELPVDEDGIVLDYPELFSRVQFADGPISREAL